MWIFRKHIILGFWGNCLSSVVFGRSRCSERVEAVEYLLTAR